MHIRRNNKDHRRLCSNEGNLALLSTFTIIFLCSMVGVYAWSSGDESWHELRTVLAGAFSAFSGALLMALKGIGESRAVKRATDPSDSAADRPPKPTEV